MKEFGEALRIVFEKISSFFDLFDLSFFISGAVVLGMVAYWLHLNGDLPSGDEAGVIPVVGFVFGAYVIGLVVFAVSRFVRGRIERWRKIDRYGKNFWVLVKAHGLEDEPPLRGQPQGRNGLNLYAQLWAELRETDSLAETYALVRRYWVLAATCDGLAGAFVAWGGLCVCRIFGWGVPESGAPVGNALLLALCLAGAFFCGREAERYTNYQTDEVLATIAFHRRATARRPRAAAGGDDDPSA